MLRRRLFRLYECGVTIESSTTYDSHLRNDCIVTRRPEWRVGGARSRTHTRAPFYTPPLRLTSAPGLRGLSRTPASRDPDSLPDRDAGAAVHASQRAELSGHRGAAEPGAPRARAVRRERRASGRTPPARMRIFARPREDEWTEAESRGTGSSGHGRDGKRRASRAWSERVIRLPRKRENSEYNVLRYPHTRGVETCQRRPSQNPAMSVVFHAQLHVQL